MISYKMKNKLTVITILSGIFVLLCFTSCNQISNQKEDSIKDSGENLENLELPELIGNNFLECSKDKPLKENTDSTFKEDEQPGYVYINPEGVTIVRRINTPEDFERVEASGFGKFLRDYPLLPDGSQVYLYDGSLKGTQHDHVAVFDMDLVPGDLQQCADSCIRLYAEYLYDKKYYDKIAFHLTNGFLVDFDTWQKGGRVSVSGNKTEWVMNGEASDSKEVFEKYLKFVFTYAGTLSVDKETSAADMKDIQAGDLFIKGGSPGHVVMVLDVCVNDAGEKAFLLGQGYMPAQQFHVLKNPAHEDDPWYYVSEVKYPFRTPEYVFDDGSFKRPGYDLAE